MKNEMYWALAPEYAQKIFARQNDPAKAQAETAGDNAPFNQILRKVGNVAVISVSGPLEKTTWVGFYSGDILSLGYDAIRRAIMSALEDVSVASILLSIDSPGGTVSGAKELADFIIEARKVKPIAAYADGLCASAAFWLASATGRIYAPATALVGSIGVIMRCENWTGFYSKCGIEVEYIASGKYKAAGSEAKELTEDERKYFQNQLAALHSLFREDVKAALALETEESLWAEAQLLPAARAAEIGLVSHIVRDESETIAILKKESEDIMPEYTYEALQKEAPELLAKIEQDAKAKAEKPDNALALACVKIICGEAAASQCEKLLAEAVELKLSGAQLAAIAEKFPAKAQVKEEDEKQSDRLQAIMNAHEKPLAPDPAPEAKSALVADAISRAEKRSRQ